MLRVTCFALIALLLQCIGLLAADPGDRTFTPLGGGQIGDAVGVGASGNLAATLPIALPSPRGELPLPFAVAYTGSNVVGAAGMGWDSPILGVTRQHNLAHRKPIHRFEGAPDPAPADRVIVNIGSGPMLMAPTQTPLTFQPFGNGYFELRSGDASFVGHDADGRLWVFQRLPALSDDDFYPLMAIVDSTGKNRVDFYYDVYDKFSPSPLHAPFDSSQMSMRELVLREITHSPDISGRCPKYRIQFEYRTWQGLTYPVSYPNLLGVDFQAGRPRAHTRLLKSIKVRSNINTSCQSFVLPTERTYALSYTADDLTGQPRLAKVDLFGSNDNTTNPSTAVPISRYRYGTPLISGGLRYEATEQLSMPPGPAGTGAGFSASLGSGAGAIYGLIRGFQDVDGDGRADFVTLDSTGQKPILAINQPSSLGNDFSTFPTQVALPNDPAAPYTIGAPDLSFGLPVLESIDNTYQQVIDFNGDGRPDIVVATDGRNDSGDRDPNFWKILINRPGPSGDPSDIVWLERQVDVTAVRKAIQAAHRLSLVSSSDDSSKPLPLSRTIQTGAFAQNTVVESGVLTQWKLTDVNGDGFPDMVFDSRDVTAFNDVSCDPSGQCQDVLRQDHPPTTSLMVIYHTGPMMAGSGAETQNVWRGPAVVLRSDGACGVERFVWIGGGERQLTCGFMEVNGDGVPDYITKIAGGMQAILSPGLAQAHDALLPENRFGPYAQQESKRTILLPGPVGLVRDPRTTACGGGTTSATRYTIDQQTGLRDVTGDGLADYIYFGHRNQLADGAPVLVPAPLPARSPGRRPPMQRAASLMAWWVMPGTGVGFAVPRLVSTPSGLPFAIHSSQEQCNGQISNVTATLQDIDGDGRPELVRAIRAQTLQIAKITNAAGELGAHSAGQLTAMDNGYGAVTHISYGSAKSSWLTRGQNPFPEIVVSQTEQTAEHGLGTGMAPVRYAYGQSDLVYHPVLGRWVSAGYRRHVTLIGEATSTFGFLEGRAIISDSIAPESVTKDLDRLMLAGHGVDTRMVAGILPDDPRQFLGNDASLAPQAEAKNNWGVRALPGSVPVLVPLDEECYATPPPETPGQFGDLVLCRRSATAYLAQYEAWQGKHPYPADDAVATRSEMLEVDDYGRATRIRNEGDLARPEDDFCTQIAYASPSPGAPIVLSARRNVRVVDCANASKVFAGIRYMYDNLPEGQVQNGFPSGRIIERHDATTAALLDQSEIAFPSRDVFGNALSVTSTRPDGATASTQYTYDPFGLRVVRTETTATGLAQPLVTELERDVQTLLPLTVTNPNGAATHSEYDGFGRRTRLSLTLPGDTTKYVLSDTAFTGFNTNSPGRSITTRTYNRWTDAASASSADPATVSTYTDVLDEFGRRMHGIVALGSDYGGQSLIVGSAQYDGLGRVRFVADPFPAVSFGSQYGVTFKYRPDGRSACSISGRGVQTLATTNESLARYPHCLTYDYADGTLLVHGQGPNELAPNRPQSGAFDETVLSATGQILSRSRWQSGVELERSQYAYDRLGALTTLTRWADPTTRTGAAIWNWSRDSFGKPLSIHEPAGLARTFSYDAWGNLIDVAWHDVTGIVGVDREVQYKYDGLSRLIRSDEVANGQTQDNAETEYFYDKASNNPAQIAPTFLLGQISFARSGGHSVFFGYDALGRQTTVSRADQGDPTHYAERSTINPSGMIESLELLLPDHTATQEQILYGYDSANRLTSVDYQDGPNTIHAWLAASTDMFGRVLEAKLGNGAALSYDYRPDGRRELLSQKVVSGADTRTIDFAGYDGGMLLQGRSDTSASSGSSAVSTAYTYDARNALVRAVEQTSAGILSDLSYDYDGLGNLQTITNAVAQSATEIRRDKHDPDRICSIVAPDAPETPCSYRYDSLGNVWQKHDTGTLLSYDAQSRLRQAEQDSQRFDLDYEPFGTLASIRAVNADGERRERFFGASARVDFLDTNGNPASAGSEGYQHFIERQIVSPVGVVALVRRPDTGSPVVLYPVGDQQGTRMVLGGTGGTAGAISYAPFGDGTPAGNPKSLSWWPYRWNGGRELEGFGLVALGKRVYDPQVGRFLQRDLFMSRPSATSAHPYGFAVNDPINNADPSGMDCIGVECLGPTGEGFQPGGGPGTLGSMSLVGSLPNQFSDDDIYRAYNEAERRIDAEIEASRDPVIEAEVRAEIKAHWDKVQETNEANMRYIENYYLNGGKEAFVANMTTANLEVYNMGAQISSVPLTSGGGAVAAEVEEEEVMGLEMEMVTLAGRPNYGKGRISVNQATGVGLINFIDPNGSDPEGNHVTAFNPLIVSNNLPRGTLIGMAHGDENLNGNLARGITMGKYLRGMAATAQAMREAGIPVRFCVGLVCGAGAGNLLRHINTFFSPELGTGGFTGAATNAIRGVVDPNGGSTDPGRMIYIPPAYDPSKP